MTEANKSVPRQPQFTLLTLLILTAAIATWIGYWRTTNRLAEIERQLQGLRNVARELRIVDEKEYAIVRRLPTRNNEHIWDVWIPKGQQFELCTHFDQGTTTGSCIPILCGEHTIEMRRVRNSKTIDVAILIDVELKDELSIPHGGGSMWSSQIKNPISQSQQQTTDRALVVHREVFNGSPAISLDLQIRKKTMKYNIEEKDRLKPRGEFLRPHSD